MGAMREGGAIHTEGDWFAGGGSWVATQNPISDEINGSDDVGYYGGYLIGESISSCNIPIISAAPDMFKALLAVKQKLHFVGMPGEKVCKVTGKSDWSDEIRLIEAALTKAVTRVPAPVKVDPVDAEFEVVKDVLNPDGVGSGYRSIKDDEVFIAGDEFDNNNDRSNPLWLDVQANIGIVKRLTRLNAYRCRRKIESVTPCVDVLKQQKPPLGLIPRKLWLEQRRDGIYDAIARYRAAGEDVNRDWLNELVDLEYDLQEIHRPA